MSKDYQIDRCRMFYTELRRTSKGPVIVSLKTSFGWYAETKDGKYVNHYPKQQHCAWCVKAETLLEYLSKQEVSHEQKQ